MQHDILSYFGNEHAQYLHAKGKIATTIMIRQLDCQPGEKVLEIGFGTGTTLVQLFSNHTKTHFYGIEQSVLMYHKAKARLRFSLIGEKINLHLMKQKGQIPFETNSFDKIYVESVLAIQEGDDLKFFLKEIQRVLKPGGILLMNETIWLDSTTVEQIICMNESCKQTFGIIQSNGHYPYLKSWNDLLTDLDYECEGIIKLDNVKDDLKSVFRFPYQLFSMTFTAIGKLKSFLSPSMQKEKKVYFQKMKEIHSGDKPLMEGIIIKAKNKR